MNLILTYQGSGDNAELVTPVLPVVAESIEQARNDFAAACLDAFLGSKSEFQVFGHRFHTCNFFRPINEQQLRQLRARYPKAKLEVHLDGYHRMHRQTMPRIEAVDAWFDRALAEARQETADFLPAT